MALDKLVDSTQLDADLTSVANAIRTKGGTSAQLAFPAGFVSAIDAIPSGGGSIQTATGTFTGDGESSEINIVCAFEPDIIYIYKKAGFSAVSYNSISQYFICRNFVGASWRSNASNTNSTLGNSSYNITGTYVSANFSASYSNGILTCKYNANSCKWAALEYEYSFVKYTL